MKNINEKHTGHFNCPINKKEKCYASCKKLKNNNKTPKIVKESPVHEV